MKILIPMAGEGSRFKKEGYAFPKPLIDVNGMPMIEAVVRNLDFDADYIFLVRKSHLENYKIESLLDNITKHRSTIIPVGSITEGAACTALLAENLINSDEELLIANSDQLIEYSQENFNIIRNFTDVDGIVFTFNSVHPKWSFVKTDARNIITEIAEKKANF